MLGLSSLRIDYRTTISDLTGLEYATNLTTLRFDGPQLSDISPLRNLTSLTELYIYYPAITDVTPLANLTNLKILGLRGQFIGDESPLIDISPMHTLTNLTFLDLRYNQISDISPLQSLTTLTELYLQCNHISDISALKNMTQMRSLRLYYNQISDISSLSEMTQIYWLELQGNEISDISPLAGMTEIHFLYLDGNQISDISALAGLIALDSLNLGGNQISDISALAGLIALDSLNLADNQISDISALRALTNITHLYLPGNQISDIAPLEGYAVIDWLELQGNPLNCEAYQTVIPKLEEIINSHTGVHGIFYDPMPAECEEPPSEPPWWFMHITDTHIGWPGSEEELLWLVNTINSMDVKPDFLLLTGDIVNNAWWEVTVLFERVQWQSGLYKRYLEIIDYLDEQVEVYEVPGNHDRYVYRPEPWDIWDNTMIASFYTKDLTAYDGYLPGSRTHEFEHKGHIFVGLDSGSDTDPGPHYPPVSNQGEIHRGTGVEMASLESLDTSKRKIIFMHHPAVNNPEDEWVINNKDDFIAFCQKPENNVWLVLSGHTHANCIFDRNLEAVSLSETTDESYPLFIQTGALSPTWLDTFSPGSYRRIPAASPPIPEESLAIPFFDVVTAAVASQANVHIYDSSERQRHLGITESGGPQREIPNSFYLSRYIDPENGLELLPEKLVIIDPSDDFIYEVVGSGEGAYRLDISFSSGDVEIAFRAVDLPTSRGAKHTYTVDWEALGRGDEGVTIEIDSDGDGTPESIVVADNDLTSAELALQTQTVIDFDPDTLKMGSERVYVTVYIELPDGFDVADIDVSTLTLNTLDATISEALPFPTEIGDYDEDGVPDLMVKFDYKAVIEGLEPGDRVMHLTGRLLDGTPLSGMDLIRVIP